MGVLKQTGVDEGHELGARCLIGRHRACDVCVDNPRVSGDHACLYWVGGHWELKDLASTNGTFIDGRRLRAGERAVVAQGTTFTLGTNDEFTLEDASPPVASARKISGVVGGGGGALRVATGGLLVLPDDDHPEVSIFEDPMGHWVVEEGDRTRPVHDGDVLTVLADEWKVDLPSVATATWQASGSLPTLETVSLRFAVSRDEEHVRITFTHEGNVTTLPVRSHHYLMLTLARARLDDAAASMAERGWVDRESLCRMLATDARRLNVDVFRARKQLASLGVHGAAGIIARRPDTGQLRLGTDRIEVTKL